VAASRLVEVRIQLELERVLLQQRRAEAVDGGDARARQIDQHLRPERAAVAAARTVTSCRTRSISSAAPSR
jgi:hypothetical protein